MKKSKFLRAFALALIFGQTYRVTAGEESKIVEPDTAQAPLPAPLRPMSQLTKNDIEQCFREARIGYGQYKDFLDGFDESSIDVNRVKTWVQSPDRMFPEWKKNEFLKCLQQKTIK